MTVTFGEGAREKHSFTCKVMLCQNTDIATLILSIPCTSVEASTCPSLCRGLISSFRRHPKFTKPTTTPLGLRLNITENKTVRMMFLIYSLWHLYFRNIKQFVINKRIIQKYFLLHLNLNIKLIYNVTCKAAIQEITQLCL